MKTWKFIIIGLPPLLLSLSAPAQLMPPNPDYQLDGWSFNSTTWYSDSNCPPVAFTNLENPTNWDGNALQVDSTDAAGLEYPIVFGTLTNITFDQGTICAWVKPDWNSGAGPGDSGRLIDVGAYGTNSPSSWWSLYFSPDGSTFNFSSETNGVFTNYLTCPISWNSNTWYFVSLTYDSVESDLYINGAWVTNGPGPNYIPDPMVVSNFFVASDVTGLQQARAQMDDLATFNYLMLSEEVTNQYLIGWDLMNGITNSGSTNPPWGGYSFDPGTNLWIAQAAISGGNFTGILSNTIPGIEYQLLSENSLAPNQWVYFGSPILAATNWAPWSLPIDTTTNFFLSALSLQDSPEGLGIPAWYLLKYYGQDTNVNINALAPADDGWTIYQQFAMGDSPDTWVTPPAPNGLNVVYNPTNNTSTLSWTASPLATGYTIQRENSQEQSGPSEFGGEDNFTVSSGSTTNYVDTVPTESLYQYAIYGPTRFVSYSIQAQYPGGQSSAWSPGVWLESWQQFMEASIVEGSDGQNYLAVNDLPPNTVALQMSRVDSTLQYYGDDIPTNDETYDMSFDISVTNSVNGLYAIDEYEAPTDKYGYDNYEWYVQAISANGSPGEPVPVSSGFVPYSAGGTTNNWIAPPFYDGREQLKQNLIFVLREAGSQPFTYDIENAYGRAAGNLTQEPIGYAYASFYDSAPEWNGYVMTPGTNDLDIYRPFYENYNFANFMFHASDIDGEGNISPRISQGASPAGSGVPCLILTNSPPYLFEQPTTNGVSISTQLTNTQTLYPYPFEPTFNDYTNDVYYDMAGDGFTYTNNSDYSESFMMNGNSQNYFGLPIQSALTYYFSASDGYNNLYTSTLSFSNSLQEILMYYIFPQVAQPELETVEYDFWNPALDSLPGDSNFSTTNASRQPMIMSAGDTINVGGYAKMGVVNGYSGAYGYLGQYFDQAYQVDTNGNVTTNSAGVLSPYGQFFDTEPGPAALVTMPDVDTGERGTDIVYAIKLQLDMNHDGTMDLSSTGPDNTSIFEPYTFWCNNNFDRWKTDSDGRGAELAGVYYSETEQDDQQSAPSGYYPYTPTPDCNYTNADGYRAIPCTRDLEDFSRLWICGLTSNLLASLPAGASVTLSMNGNDNINYFAKPYPGTCTIDLFAAADPDGGIGYQTNELTASNQIDTAQCPYIGRLGPGDSIQLNSLMNQVPVTHFIWCGVSNGVGQLTLTISYGTNILGQTSAYIQIEDIKQMYERWTVGDDCNALPTNIPSLNTEGLGSGVTAFQYPWPQQATSYFLFVHGYNMPDWAKDAFANTAYKRLYWQGYQGRFGAFQWPTTVANYSGPHFDKSEYESWNSGAGLLNLLTNLNHEYPDQVYVMAHSHGNVAVGEALRQATQQGLGQIVNTYIAAQAALDSHTYDPTTPERSFSFSTPDRYGQYYTDGATNYFSGVSAAGTFVNFYNTNDWTMASNVWQADENEKPDVNYGYTPDPDTWFRSGPPDIDLYFPQDTYTIFAYCDQAHAYSVGAQPNVGGAFLNVTGTETNYSQVNLPSVWPPDPANNDYRDHLWHSAEFRSDYPQRWLFWDETLVQMGLKTHL